MKRILVLGAGRSATDLIHYLLAHATENQWQIIVGDYNLELAREKVAGNPNGKAIAFNVFDDDFRNQQIAKADLAVSMLPPDMHPLVAQSCLDHHTHMVTASYIHPEINEIRDAVKEKGLIFLNEMGADPGIDHMNAIRTLDMIREKEGEVLSFHSYCGSLIAPESVDNPWGYKFTWSPMNVITAGQGGARYIEQHHLRVLPYHRLFANPIQVEIPGAGPFEAYPNRDTLPYRKKYQLEGVPTMMRATLRMPGYINGWHQFVRLGLTDNSFRIEHSDELTYRDWVASFLPDPDSNDLESHLFEFLGISDNPQVQDQIRFSGILSGQKIPVPNLTSAEILMGVLTDRLKFKDGDIDMLVFMDTYVYTYQGKTFEHRSCMATKGIDQHHTAISRCVGLPAAIGVKLILNDKIKQKGVLLPLSKEIYEPVLNELASLGIKYDATEQEIVA